MLDIKKNVNEEISHISRSVQNSPFEIEFIIIHGDNKEIYSNVNSKE